MGRDVDEGGIEAEDDKPGNTNGSCIRIRHVIGAFEKYGFFAKRLPLVTDQIQGPLCLPHDAL